MRGQAKPPDEKKADPSNAKKIGAVKDSWLALKSVLGTMYASVAVGPYSQRVGDLEAAIGDLK